MPYNLLTAFEVFEHLVDPKSSLELMLEYSRNVFFSTELQPKNWRPDPNTWWYILPETGQHVSLYSVKSLHILAEQHGLQYKTGQNNMHIFSEQSISQQWFTGLTNWRGSKLYNYLASNQQISLLDADYAKLRWNQSGTKPFAQ